jgi:tight adherence protein B
MDASTLYVYLRTAGLVALPIAGAMLLAWSVVSIYLDLRAAKYRKILERLNEFDSLKYTKKVNDGILKQERFFDSGVCGKILASITPFRKLQKMFVQADISWTVQRYMIFAISLAGVSFSLSMFFYGRVFLSLMVAVLLVMASLWIINIRRKRRMKKLVEQLPEAFELISQSLRAGHSLNSGIQVVGSQMPDPVGSVFARVFVEQSLGLAIEDALKNMAERIDQLDLKMFVTAILVQRQTGGNLTEILEKISGFIRERLKILGQAKALTAEGRLSGWVLCILPILIFLVVQIINPKYTRILLEEKRGQSILVIAGILQVIGMLFIRKIVNIKI